MVCNRNPMGKFLYIFGNCLKVGPSRAIKITDGTNPDGVEGAEKKRIIRRTSNSCIGMPTPQVAHGSHLENIGHLLNSQS